MTAHQPPLAKYALRYAREGLESKLLTKKPLFLTVFVTARCGLNCGHCFYREELLNGTITGGEPFLRHDLVDIAEKFYENSSGARQITIPTAGTHTDRIVALVERLLGPRPDLILEIQLSIDGVGEHHDEVRGKGQWDKLMRTYEALKPIQDRNAGLRIRFNYTFSRKTQDWFEETWRFVTQTLGNPHFDMVLVRRTTVEDAYWGRVDLDKYRRATELLQQQE